MRAWKQWVQKGVLCALLLAALAPLTLAGEHNAGTLVFSLKFAGDKLEVHSVSLVPGSSPDYKLEPKGNWLAVDFLDAGSKLKTIKVPDPRALFLETVEENNSMTGMHLREENAALVFAAPNVPSASTAEISDENGTKLLSIDYRRGIRLDAPSALQPQTREFGPPEKEGGHLPVAAFLGAAALLVAFLASRQQPPKQEEEQLEENVDELISEQDWQ